MPTLKEIQNQIKFTILMVFSMLIFFSGCVSDNKQNNSNETTTNVQTEQKPVEKTPEQIQAEQEESEQKAAEAKAEQERRAAEQAERDAQLLAKSAPEIYQWCYWMFYKIGYSDDVLQYHMSNGSSESMRDLKFVMGEFQKDLNGTRGVGNLIIPNNVPTNLKVLMNRAKNDLMQSLILRQNAAKKSLGDSVSTSGSKEDMINKSNQLKNSAEEQLRQIQSKLPEGIKYHSWQEVYDPND